METRAQYPKILKRGIEIDRSTRAMRYKGFTIFFFLSLSHIFCLHFFVILYALYHIEMRTIGESKKKRTNHVHNNGYGCFECHEGKNGMRPKGQKTEGIREQMKQRRKKKITIETRQEIFGKA